MYYNVISQAKEVNHSCSDPPSHLEHRVRSNLLRSKHSTADLFYLTTSRTGFCVVEERQDGIIAPGDLRLAVRVCDQLFQQVFCWTLSPARTCGRLEWLNGCQHLHGWSKLFGCPARTAATRPWGQDAVWKWRDCGLQPDKRATAFCFMFVLIFSTLRLWFFKHQVLERYNWPHEIRSRHIFTSGRPWYRCKVYIRLFAWAT